MVSSSLSLRRSALRRLAGDLSQVMCWAAWAGAGGMLTSPHPARGRTGCHAQAGYEHVVRQHSGMRLGARRRLEEGSSTGPESESEPAVGGRGRGSRRVSASSCRFAGSPCAPRRGTRARQRRMPLRPWTLVLSPPQESRAPISILRSTLTPAATRPHLLRLPACLELQLGVVAPRHRRVARA